MKLLIEELTRKLPPLGATKGKAPEDVKVFFHIIDHASREFVFPTEFDPQTGVCHGLVASSHTLTMRNFSMNDLKPCKGTFRSGVELFYLTEKNLAEVKAVLLSHMDLLKRFLVFR